MFSCLCVGALHVITYKKRKNNLKVQIYGRILYIPKSPGQLPGAMNHYLRFNDYSISAALSVRNELSIFLKPAAFLAPISKL